MKDLFTQVLILVIVASSAAPSFAQDSFKPAEVISAPDIQSPILSMASGLVVLDVSLDDKGAITESAVVRDIQSLTSAATSSTRSWKFSPATVNGTPVASVMRVIFVFRPRSYLAAGPHFAPLLADGDHDQIGNQGYTPPGILSATYPEYPVDAAFPGAVIVQLTVSKGNEINHLSVVRDWHPFTRFALGAVYKWRFQAGTLGGRPTMSRLAIAFVFAAPPPNY